MAIKTIVDNKNFREKMNKNLKLEKVDRTNYLERLYNMLI